MADPAPTAAPRVLAAIDVGTNTTRLLVARLTPGGLVPMAQSSTMTALGEGMSLTGRIGPNALEFTEHTVAAMAAEARDLGAARMMVACTAIGRDAVNSHELLLALERATGVKPRVLSGEEEAALSFAGLLSAGVPPEFVAADLGGGSLELMGGRDGVLRWGTSLDIGVRKLTERYDPSDPPSLDLLGPMVAHARQMVTPVADAHPTQAVVATGGSAAALAVLAGADVLTRDAMVAVVERLAAASADDIAADTGLEPARVRLCLAGAAVLEAVRRAFDVEGLHVSEAGIREGLLMEAAG